MTTTTTTPWAHLPNAVHIDRVIVSAKANPNQWAKAWWAIHHPAWGGARNILREQNRVEVWIEAREAGWYAATRYAIIALCAYDDCAYMLDSDPGELAIVAEFGNRNAILLLPACKAFHSLKELA